MSASTLTPAQFNRYATRPCDFREDLVVDVDGTPRQLGLVMDPWQNRDFRAIDPALMRCNGRIANQPAEPIRQRAYLERGRGHSKTTDLAVTCCWAMAFATRPIRGYAFAADRDQAGLLKDAMQTIVRLNPWLGKILVVQRNEIINVANGHPGEGAKLEIFTSDVGSSYGILPDLIIADELCHWEGDGSLWHSLISSAAKRSNCFLCVISNAGFADSWQWDVREIARTDQAWYFSRLEGPVASWLSQARLDEQRRMLPPNAFMRLWGNVWSSGGGDALTPADIEAAFLDGLAPMEKWQPGWIYVAGVDLGLTRDCSAVVLLAIPDKRYAKVRLASHKLWRPALGRKIDLSEIEHHILDLDNRFNIETVAFDPWNSELLAQRLEADTNHRRRNQQRRHWTKPWCREVQPTASNLREQATLCVEYFNDRRLEFFQCEPLRRDLHKLRIEEKSYGIRLTSPRDGEGHGDTFSAFSLALLAGHELAGKRPVKAGCGTTKATPMSAFDRAMASFQAEQKRYAEEMAFLHEAGRSENRGKRPPTQPGR